MITKLRNWTCRVLHIPNNQTKPNPKMLLAQDEGLINAQQIQEWTAYIAGIMIGELSQRQKITIVVSHATVNPLFKKEIQQVFQPNAISTKRTMDETYIRFQGTGSSGELYLFLGLHEDFNQAEIQRSIRQQTSFYLFVPLNDLNRRKYDRFSKHDMVLIEQPYLKTLILEYRVNPSTIYNLTNLLQEAVPYEQLLENTELRKLTRYILSDLYPVNNVDWGYMILQRRIRELSQLLSLHYVLLDSSEEQDILRWLSSNHSLSSHSYTISRFQYVFLQKFKDCMEDIGIAADQGNQVKVIQILFEAMIHLVNFISEPVADQRFTRTEIKLIKWMVVCFNIQLQRYPFKA